MGKIKQTILSKQDRPVTESKPPSYRRQIRAAKAGRIDRRGYFPQHIPDVVILKLNKAIKRTVINEHHVNGKDVTSVRKIEQIVVRANDSAGVRRIEQMAKAKQGHIKRNRRRTVWHNAANQLQKPEKNA